MSLMTSDDVEARARGLLAQDHTAQAVALAFAHGLDDLAAELLAAGWLGMLCGGAQFDAFFAAVERIGIERYQRWPQLEAASIFALTLQMHLRVAALRLDDLEQRVPGLQQQGRSFLVGHQRAPYDRPDPCDGMHSWIGMMRVLLAAFGGRSKEALKLAEAWRQRFVRAPDYELATVLVSESLALSMLDRIREAEREALGALAIYRRERFELGMAWATVCAASMKAVTGRVTEARALLDSTLDQAAPRLQQASQTLAAIDIARNYVAFESGEFESALAESLERIEGRRVSTPLPIMMLLDRVVAARSLMALGRSDQALALLSRHDLERPIGDLAYWNRFTALERARVAVVSGSSDAAAFQGPAEVRVIVRLMSLVRRHPAAMMLGPLRALAREAEEQQHDEQLFLALFLKARVEQDTGNPLQARRSVTRLLTLPSLQQRLGSIASLAPALQPMFGDAMHALLQEAGGHDERLLHLARLTGTPTAQAAASGPAEALSAREEQIGAALLDGLSNRQIAQRMHLSEQTVRWHLWKLFQKLGVSNRLGAAQLLSARKAMPQPGSSTLSIE